MIKRLPELLTSLVLIASSALMLSAQETPPLPSEPRSVTIPAVKETKLPNGLTVVVVERRSSPLVSVRMTFNSGVTSEDIASAGLVKMTTSLLTKGTTTRSATQIANDIEFLGADFSTAVALDSSSITLNVTSDKVGQAMPIFADVIRRASFPANEIKLAQSQAIDELAYNLKQPSFLANYVATVYSFNGNPASGTPESLKSMKRTDILEFYRNNINPKGATLLFVGDISPAQAVNLARTHFGTWKSAVRAVQGDRIEIMESAASVQQRKDSDREQQLAKRILVIDLPGSGQAAVSFAKQLPFAGRVKWADKSAEVSKDYFPGVVMNSLLGGGYSSRLNQEIRIKRGLSYGAGSSITWRAYDARFSTRTQTKNESAPEVAELVLTELRRLGSSDAVTAEIAPRQAALIGDFGRSLETNSSLINGLADLYDVWLSPDELGAFIPNVQSVSAAQIRNFAAQHLNGGDIIIVGDYAKFRDDLAKRFSGMKINVVMADELDLSKTDLRK